MAKEKRLPKSGKKKAGKKPNPFSSGGAIAITGVAGFIGSNLLKDISQDPRYLKKRLILLDINKPDFPLSNAKYYKLDLTLPLADTRIADILKREGCDTFIHLSFISNPSHDEGYAHELQVIGTMYVLNACQEVGIRKLVVASTTMAYGAIPSNPNFLTESHPLKANPKYAFARDRVEVETLVSRYMARNPKSIVTVLRVGTILGPNVRNVATRYFNNPVIYTVMGYDPLMQFIHEDDALRAFKLALEKDFSGIFNIAGRKVLPLSTVLKIAGKVNMPIPGFILYPTIDTLWLAGASYCPALHLDYIKYLCVADGEKARKEMGFEAGYTTKETIESFVGYLRLTKLHLAGAPQPAQEVY